MTAHIAPPCRDLDTDTIAELLAERRDAEKAQRNAYLAADDPERLQDE